MSRRAIFGATRAPALPAWLLGNIFWSFMAVELQIEVIE
jgi:hypothetical protein